ncbi:MAG: tRNA pseudouridine(55) synthase [Phycisphaerae bacterium]
MPPGLYLLYKPVGVTSFSLVQAALDAARVADPRHRPKVVHGGALDPFAHGLLVLLTGPAVKLFEYLHPIPKTYEATIRWGVETDNGDLLGQPVATGDAASLTRARLDAAMAPFVGWHDQVPPATSNKRVGGERAYAKAHRGEAVELPPSRVYLHSAEWVSHDLPRASVLRVVVRGGYYVRALARDLGRALGCRAHLATLHRTAIGPYVDPGPGSEPAAVSSREILSWAPSRILDDNEVGELRAGRSIAVGAVSAGSRLPEGFPDSEAPVRGITRARLAFLLRREDGRLVPITEFRGGI